MPRHSAGARQHDGGVGLLGTQYVYTGNNVGVGRWEGELTQSERKSAFLYKTKSQG